MYLNRDIFTLKTTSGILKIADSRFQCYTLEDVARALGVKIYGETAIQQGEYIFRLTKSNKFRRVLPLIYNEPDWTINDGAGVLFKGVRMHNGNNHANTEGCILCAHERNESGTQIFKGAADDLMVALSELGMKENDYGTLLITNKQTR